MEADMATLARSVSGTNITYLITDVEGSSTSVIAATAGTVGTTLTFTSSGGLHQDGQQMLAQLMLQLSTGLLP
jgi:hypothetical protein